MTIVNDHWQFATTAAAEQRRRQELDSLRALFESYPSERVAGQALDLLRDTMRGAGYTVRLRLLLDQLIGWHQIPVGVRACIEAWAEAERERLP